LYARAPRARAPWAPLRAYRAPGAGALSHARRRRARALRLAGEKPGARPWQPALGLSLPAHRQRHGLPVASDTRRGARQCAARRSTAFRAGKDPALLALPVQAPGRVGAHAPRGGMMPREGSLELLRFLAAFAVLAFHFGFRGYAAHNLQDLAFPELAGFSKYGYMGVELFFMISGYVIPWSIRGRSVAEFALARAIRLYPTYWLCAALLLFVPPLLGESR